jgi:CheY-like chemotaxis protein
MCGAKFRTATRGSVSFDFSPRPRPRKIMFIGDPQQLEFRVPMQWFQANESRLAGDLREALNQIDGGVYPAVVILGVAWPGGFSSSEVSALRRAAPLARVVALLGSWLEGESRTGQPLAGIPRVHWHQWPRLADEIEKFQRQQPSVFSVPITARDDERWHHSSHDCSTDDRRNIAVVAKSRESAIAFVDLCAAQGWNGQWIRNITEQSLADFDMVLFDAQTGGLSEFALVSRIRSRNPELPIVVLQGFLRTDDESAWIQSGANAVIGKPFLIRDLLDVIERSPAPLRASSNRN